MAFVKKEVLGCVASADAVHLQTVRPHGKLVARVSCLGVVSEASRSFEHVLVHSKTLMLNGNISHRRVSRLVSWRKLGGPAAEVGWGEGAS